MTNDDHDPEPPIVTRTTREAQDIVKKVTTLLQLAGWDCIILSVSRALEVSPGEYQAPGATATVIDPSCEPLIPQIVRVLRLQADALERTSVDKEITSGYIQDQTSYATGMAEWPQ